MIDTGKYWPTIRRIDSSENSVTKYVFECEDAVAESVLYRYPTYEDRTVICCSTQSGCPVGCRFCGAGDNFARSLTMEEIVSQPVYLLRESGVQYNDIKKLQIMFMSMGEPMLNQRALLPALKVLHGAYPKAKLLVSTVGPQVDYSDFIELSQQIDTIGLQFSIHESTDEARNMLIPFVKKMDLYHISTLGAYWGAVTGRRPFINYCASEDNTTDADIDRLQRLFAPGYWEVTVSVVCERDEHIAAANERQRCLASSFMAKMIARGYSVRMFDPAGQDDIGGGCGQLWFVQDWMRKNSDKVRPSCGSGLTAIHAPK